GTTDADRSGGACRGPGAATPHHRQRGPRHDGPRRVADHGAVLRRAGPQQQDGPGVLLVGRPPVPLRRPRRPVGLDRGRRAAPPDGGRRRRQEADARPQGDPGRLRRRDPRVLRAGRCRAGGPDLALDLRLRDQRRRGLQPAAPGAVLRRPARRVDRHPLHVGQGGHRAGPRALRARGPVGDPVHRHRRLHHDVPVGLHDQRRADERLRQRPRALQRRPRRRVHRAEPGADGLRRRRVGLQLLLDRPRDRVHGRDHHGPARAGAAHDAPLACALRLVHADLPGLRPAREHHDRVPRRRADHPARPHRPVPGRPPAAAGVEALGRPRDARRHPHRGDDRRGGPVELVLPGDGNHRRHRLAHADVGRRPGRGHHDRLRARLPDRAAGLRAPARGRRARV
ncbi:MAG: hypothetical protein AVDCRST_MAG69-2158, partial [uncultured Solirubrobacteraceae bacterium]